MNIKSEIKEALVENKRIFEILTVLFILGFIIGCIFADDIASYLMPILKEAMGVEGGISSINAWDIMIRNQEEHGVEGVHSGLFRLSNIWNLRNNFNIH